MSAVVGVDLSSFAIDLVKLDETSNRAAWVRVPLAGKDAWERTIHLHSDMAIHLPVDFFEDVYLVALEEPRGRGQAGTNAILNRVVGAIAASLPAKLRAPERCWLVPPHEWKKALGLKAKPTWGDLDRIAGATVTCDYPDSATEKDRQNFRDAFCIALWARTENAKGVAA